MKNFDEIIKSQLSKESLSYVEDYKKTAAADRESNFVSKFMTRDKTSGNLVGKTKTAELVDSFVTGYATGFTPFVGYARAEFAVDKSKVGDPNAPYFVFDELVTAYQFTANGGEVQTSPINSKRINPVPLLLAANATVTEWDNIMTGYEAEEYSRDFATQSIAEMRDILANALNESAIAAYEANHGANTRTITHTASVMTPEDFAEAEALLSNGRQTNAANGMCVALSPGDYSRLKSYKFSDLGEGSISEVNGGQVLTDFRNWHFGQSNAIADGTTYAFVSGDEKNRVGSTHVVRDIEIRTDIPTAQTANNYLVTSYEVPFVTNGRAVAKLQKI